MPDHPSQNIFGPFETAVNEIKPRLQELGLTEARRELDRIRGEFYMRFLFDNRSESRRLEITGRTVPSAFCSISIFPIPRDPERKVSIMISDYLAKRCDCSLKDLYARDIKSHNKMPQSEYFREYLAIAMRYIETDLRDVVEGKRWEDVPFDWTIAGR